MKSTVLYHYYGPIRKNRCCRQLNIKQLAIASAVYTLVSLLIQHTHTTQKNELFSYYYEIEFSFESLAK